MGVGSGGGVGLGVSGWMGPENLSFCDFFFFFFWGGGGGGGGGRVGGGGGGCVGLGLGMDVNREVKCL